MKGFFILIAGFLLLISSSVLADSPEIDSILFRKSYENYAWVKTYEGILVDVQGQVFSFRFPAEKLGPMLGYVPPRTIDELKKYFNQNLKFIKTVDKDELQRMAALIPEVAVASHSARTDNARDAGQNLWIAYQIDETAKTFKTIKIKEMGDSVQNSLAPSAKVLVEWLDGLKK